MIRRQNKPMEKMKLLFVDDRSKRIHSALKKYGDDYDVVIAPNVPEALRLLSSQEWDIVSLDFDLDGNDFVDPESKTCAMEIVRYFKKTGWRNSRRLPVFIIHSSNSFGAEMLASALKDYFSGATEIETTRYEYIEGEQ